MTDENDLAMLRDMAREWIANEHPATPDHQVARSGIRERWAAMAELGWTGTLVSESAGGSEMGLGAFAILVEESGRELMISPLIASGLIACEALSGDMDRLSRLVSGEYIVGFAHDETGHHASDVTTRAERGPGGWTLHGTKRFVMDGAIADALLVTAMADDGLGLFLVDAGALSVQTRDTIDGRAMADVGISQLVLPTEARVAMDPQAIARLLDLARLALAAEMLGAARKAFDITVEYLRTREQFDRPIGSFQALQHRAAQMLVELELTQECVADGWATAERKGDLAGPAALAKHMAGETLALVAREMVQMHGGIGMTAEHVAGRYLKWSEVSRKLFGDDSWLVDRWATASGF